MVLKEKWNDIAMRCMQALNELRIEVPGSGHFNDGQWFEPEHVSPSKVIVDSNVDDPQDLRHIVSMCYMNAIAALETLDNAVHSICEV